MDQPEHLEAIEISSTGDTQLYHLIDNERKRLAVGELKLAQFTES